ncbi:Uu.00g079780.m01.CDS01 [Anthostomella pinea]|uniref:Uu.00g079780.m01.CDS01 n=1 Tax=Anthostomella pinea TaxID=933095 RepID=A0AAI8VLJ3_9PEZI|nr:Uu.00g079780.m01.CDS01 [Anthostomella pinea]
MGRHYALLHNPPRGTPSRILSLRLHRSFHLPPASRRVRRAPGPSTASVARLIEPRAIRNAAGGLRHATTQSHAAVSAQEIALIEQLVRWSRSRDLTNTAANSHGAQQSADNVGAQDVRQPNEPVSGANPEDQLADPFRLALFALRARDTRKLLLQLRRITRMPQEQLQHAVATLPRTTFTEFFRSLDPYQVLREVDPAQRAFIPPGMFSMLDMDSVVDDNGVRRIYGQLLQGMLVLMSALKDSGQYLHMDEYNCLMRCAGAASDPAGAKFIWREMDTSNTTIWRQSQAYTEFMAARFLTEALYTNYDKMRRLVQPRNLHRSRLRLANTRVYRLDRMRLNLRRSRFKFGLNKDVKHAEDVMRYLRNQGPPMRLFSRILKNGHGVTERLLCTVMVALGRTGSLRAIGSKILEAYFGISMSRLTYDEPRAVAGAAAASQIELRRVNYRIRPSVGLMRAVVETYGSNGEISVAFQLIDHISNSYAIPIPFGVWDDLLEWTYIMSSPPTSTTWKLAGMYSKVPSGQAVQMIWNAMTSPPYSIKPDFKQYSILIRSFLGRSMIDDALPYMRETVKLYEAKCQEYEEAVFRYTQHMRDGVNTSQVVRAYERAWFRKQYMWYDIHRCCRAVLLKCPRAGNLWSTRFPNPMIPGFIKEFGAFLTNPIEFRTRTGDIALRDPALETFRTTGGRDVVMDVPMRQKQVWVHQRVKRRKMLLESSHSFAKQKASELDPLALLLHDFRKKSNRPLVRRHPVWEPAFDDTPAPQFHGDDDDDV